MPLAFVADKLYGSIAIRQTTRDESAVAVILSNSNARVPIPHDPNLYVICNPVERFFRRIKDMRRLTMRYKKLKRNFLSMLHIFAIRCRLNRAQTLTNANSLVPRRAETFNFRTF